MKKQFTIFLITIIFFIFGVFVSANQVYAETEVSGNITSDTTWTLANSPYIVTGTIQVLQGSKLTIEPGVIVKFNQNTGLNIDGELYAVGEINNLITFTKQETSWNGILFSNNASKSVLDNNFNYLSGNIIKFSKIEYAGIPFQRCAIQSNINLYISNSEVINNSLWCGVDINVNDSFQSNCAITHNIINNNTGVNSKGLMVNGCKKALISNNNFDFNDNFGLIVKDNIEISIENNSVNNMGYRNNEYSAGILISSAAGSNNNISITNNIIKNNYTGVWIESSNSARTIKYNNIANNTYGVQSSNHGGTFINNNNLDNISYNFYYRNQSGNNLNVDAKYNYWSSVSKSNIETKIRDYYDDISLGKVNYEPYGLAELKFNGTDTFSQPEVCISWVYSDWSACSNGGQQTRSAISSSPSGCSGGNPVLIQSCTYTPPICTSWTYSNWSTCVNGQQTRTIISSQPANCAGGNPISSQSCDSTSLCTENNWTSTLTPITCPNSDQQTKKWTKVGECEGGISHPPEEIVSCDYRVPACTNFTYSDWGVCGSSGVQSRTILSVSPFGCEGGNLILSKSCNYTAPCDSDTWSCESWSDCSVNGSQTRVCTKTFDCTDTQTQSPTINQPCEVSNQNSQNETQFNQAQNEQVAEQRKSEVANAIQEILHVAEEDTEIGQQIKTIAQTQVQNQEQLEVSLQKAQNRNKIVKFFVGPDYEEINNAKKLLEQNREQIGQLNQVKNQIADQDDQQKLSEQIELFEKSNQEIEDSLNATQKGFSLFGWLIKLFEK